MTDGLVLAVDGGNSKTDVVLVDQAGRVRAHARGPGSSPHHVGVDGCVDVVDELVLEAAAQAGLAPGLPVAMLGEVYLAGVDFPIEKDSVAAAVRRRAWAPEVVVDNDTFALLRAGTDVPDSVAVVCGAGINCVGVSADGRHARFASLGRLSGDWGGGGELGEEAMWWAARAVDGRGPETLLSGLVPQHFDLPDVPAVYEAIHFGRLSSRRILELAPTVLAARDPILLDGIDERLAEAAPKARTVVTEVSPVVGAALLGLDRLGADPEAKQRLRGQLPMSEGAA